MDYMSPERSLDGACGDPGPLFEDPDGSLLEHMDYHGEGIARNESPALNDGLLVDAADQISFMSADSVPYMNDQILGNTMKSASTSPASPLKQDKAHHVYIESDDFEAHITSPGYAVHQETKVVDAVLPPELRESSGNGTSNFQQEATHSDAYLGDSMLNENNSRDYQFSTSGDDDDEIPNSSVPQMENKDNEKLHETFHSEVNGKEDDQMCGGNSDPRDEHDNENFNPAISPSYLDGMEQEDLGTENGVSTPGNQWDSPPERSAGLEKGTPSPARRVSLSVERSPRAHSSDKLDSPRHAEEDGNLARSRSPPARHRSRSLEKRDTNRSRRASSRELSPHARDSSPPEKRAHSRRGDGSPQRRSASPRRKDRSPRRRSASPKRRDGSPQRRSASPKRRDGSPHRRSASPKRRHGSPRRRSPSPKRRHGSPRRRSPSPKRRHGSPRRRSSSPKRRHGSPRQRSPSPKRRHGSPRRRSPSPKRRASPKRRGSPRRRDSPSRRKDSPPRRRDSSPRKRNSSPRKRDSSPRRRDSPSRKRDRSKSRSPSRKTDSSRHRREHGRSRSRSPHSRDHHKRSPRRRHSPRHRSPPASHRQHSSKRPWSPPANRKTGLGKPGKNLFVAGFSYATTEQELEKKFAEFGRVTRVRVVRDRRTGDSRGFGFLSLEKDEDADAAIKACDETEWNGRIILVEKSKTPTL